MRPWNQSTLLNVPSFENKELTYSLIGSPDSSASREPITPEGGASASSREIERGVSH